MTGNDTLDLGNPTRTRKEPVVESLSLHSTDLLTLLDPAGTILYESPAIERLYGYDQEELVGQQVTDYFHPEDCHRVMAAFDAVVAGEAHHTESVEYRHRMADGSYRWIESVGSSHPTPEGNYVISSRDISERKQREQELQKARQQLQSECDSKEAIRQLLVESSRIDDVADAVCQLLVESCGYDAAWVVTAEGSSDEIGVACLASHGSDRGFCVYGEEIWTPDAATRQCLDTGEPVVVAVDGKGGKNDAKTGSSDKTETEDDDAPLVERLRACEFTSVRAVPLVYDGVMYGTLTAVRSDPCSEFARELVAEVAAALAFRQQAVRQQMALRADRVTELTLRIPEGHVLAALASSPLLPDDTHLIVEEYWDDDGDLSVYLLKTATIEGETLVEAAGDLSTVEQASVVTESDEETVVQLRVDEPAVGATLSGHGVLLRSAVASKGYLKVTVQFSRPTAVSVVTEAIQDRWPAATLQACSQQTLDPERPQHLEGLTRKQEEALRAATFAGFFQRPQRSNAREVAEVLNISRSTFLHHLRVAEQKAFTDIFGVDDI